MHLRVINLPQRADRRAQFEAWNARAGLDIAFVPGVNAAELDLDRLVRDGLLAADARFTHGQIGSSLAHRAVWVDAANAHGLTFACEDDACLRGDFVARAEALVAQLGDNWDVVFFGCNTNALIAVDTPEGVKALMQFDDGAKRGDAFFADYAKLTAGPSAALRCYQIWGLLSYALTPRGARRLLASCFPLTRARPFTLFGNNQVKTPWSIDGMLNVALQRDPLVAYCAFPALAQGPNDLADSDASRR